MIRVSGQGRRCGPGVVCIHSHWFGCVTFHVTEKGRGLDGACELLCEKAKREKNQRKSHQSGTKPVKLFDLYFNWIFASLELTV